jgi:hypothetical protein
MTRYRHGRARPGHPRLVSQRGRKDVDARDKRGHDGEPFGENMVS